MSNFEENMKNILGKYGQRFQLARDVKEYVEAEQEGWVEINEAYRIGFIDGKITG